MEQFHLFLIFVRSQATLVLKIITITLILIQYYIFYIMSGQSIALSSINADYRLMGQMTWRREPQQLVTPKTLQELSVLVKRKLAGGAQELKFAGRQWLGKKGLDVQRMYQQVTAQKQRRRLQPQKEVSRDSYFYLSQVKVQNLEEYLQRAKQYSCLNLLQKVMSGNKHGQFMSRMIKRMHGDEVGRDYVDRLRVTNLHERSPKKQNEYLEIVKGPRDSMLETICNKISNRFWETFRSQLWGNHEKRLLVNSLSIIQEQLGNRLPANTDMLNYYITNTYLNKLNQNYSQEGIDFFWAKCFLLYRGGRKNQCFQLLSEFKDLQFVSSLYQSTKLISQFNPRKMLYEPLSGLHDPFYEQLMYAMNGQSRYSNEMLVKDQWQNAWVLLRNVGIFEQDKSKFKNLRDSMLNRGGNKLDSQSVLVRLSLMDYDGLVRIGENQLMDKDDYLHWLLVLQNYQFLLDNPTKFYQRVCFQLRRYILELINQRSKNYIYYLCFFPKRTICQEVSWIISSSRLIEEMDWQFLKEKFDKYTFEQTVRASLNRCVQKEGNYLMIAKKCMDILGNKEQAVQYLIQMIVEFMHGKVYDIKEVNDSIALGLHWCLDQCMKSYEKIMQLFKSIVQIKKLIVERSQHKLINFIIGCDLVVIDAMDEVMGSMLQKLANFEALDIYCDFLCCMIKGAQIGMLKLLKLKELKVFKELVLKSAQIIKVSYGQISQRLSELIQELKIGITLSMSDDL